MPVDLSVFGKIKTPDDYRRAEEMFQLEKQKVRAGQYGSTPAAIKINQEIEQRLKMGDREGANRLMQIQKVYDKGINPYGQPIVPPQAGQEQQIDDLPWKNQQGGIPNTTPPYFPSNGQNGGVPRYSPSAIPGYADAISSIEGAKAGAKQQAEKDVDYMMNPQIRAAETAAEYQQKLGYEPQLRMQNKTAEISAEKKGMFSKAQNALSTLESQSNRVVSEIDKALNLAENSSTATGWGNVATGWAPNTDARALNNALMTIKANVGFDKLQSMRDNSPTGGALGQVSEFENRLLQAVNGALDPLQKDQLVENLRIIQEMYPKVLQDRRVAFQTDYADMLGGNQQGGTQYIPTGGNIGANLNQQPVPANEGMPNMGDIVDGYVFLGGDPANEKSWKKAR